MAEYIDREALFKRLKEETHDYDAVGKYKEGIIKGLNIAKSIVNDKARTPTADVVEVKWISVKDKLPEKHDAYLCAEYSKMFNQYFVRILYFAEDLYKWDRFAFPDGKGKSGFYWSDSEWGCGLADGVTHWMPLPEPPTKEGADNG